MNKNGKFIYDTKEIAEQFNIFFLNTSNHIIENIPRVEKTYEQYLVNPSIHSIFLDPVDSYDVKTIISKLKPKTSSGFDEISCKLIRLTAESVIEPLTFIINLSITTGRVPNQMKVAKVVPIFKSGDQYNFSNYRPVSLLPDFSVILERTIYNKVVKYLDINNTLYRHQYGFRKKT